MLGWRATNRIKKWIPLSYRIFPEFQSKTIGFDDSLEAIKKPVRLKGYFQTWVYFEDFKNDFTLLPNEHILTDWSRQIACEIFQTNPILLHVRRGDYKSLKESFGILSAEYYSNALEHLKKLGINRPIWIFSDEINSVKIEFSNLNFQVERYVDAPKGIAPSEILHLMSPFKFIVIGNSTFSWWAASLNGDQNKTVIAPTKWFRNLPDPELLIPKHWTQITSAWAEV
jgi:hypothetical protein